MRPNRDLSEYFKTNEDYLIFIESLTDQLNEVTFNGQRKIESANPIFKGGSSILRFLPFKTLPKEGYYLRLNKMSKITTD